MSVWFQNSVDMEKRCRQETELSQRLCDTWAVYLKVNYKTILHCSCTAEPSDNVSSTAAKSATSSAAKVSKLQFPTGATTRWTCGGAGEAEGGPSTASQGSDANSKTAECSFNQKWAPFHRNVVFFGKMATLRWFLHV